MKLSIRLETRFEIFLYLVISQVS